MKQVFWMENTCLQKPKSHSYISKIHYKVFSRFSRYFKKLLQIYSICTFAYAFAFKFKYAVAHAHPHAQMYLHLHLHVHLHSLAHAVHNFICAHVQCIGIRACIIFALPNCCFCSIFLDIRSSPQFFLLEKYFPTVFLLEKPLFAYTPFRHHFSLGKFFFKGKTGFFIKRKLKTLGKFQKHFGNFFRDLENYFGKCTRTNSIWKNALEKCSSRLKLFSLRKKNSKSSPSKEKLLFLHFYFL